MVSSAIKSIPNVPFIIKTNETIYSSNIKTKLFNKQNFFLQNITPIQTCNMNKKKEDIQLHFETKPIS